MGIYVDYDGVNRTQNNRVLGPKYYNVNGIWALKPCYLGPRTLRELFITGVTALSVTQLV